MGQKQKYQMINIPTLVFGFLVCRHNNLKTFKQLFFLMNEIENE